MHFPVTIAFNVPHRFWYVLVIITFQEFCDLYFPICLRIEGTLSFILLFCFECLILLHLVWEHWFLNYGIYWCFSWVWVHYPFLWMAPECLRKRYTYSLLSRCKVQYMYCSAQATTIKYCRLVAGTIESCWSSSGDQEVQNQGAGEVGFILRPLLMACRWLPCCYVLPWPLLLRARIPSWGFHPHDLILPKGPLSKCHYTGGQVFSTWI